jgi:hypothetical protein
MIDGMMNPQTIDETSEIMREAIKYGVHVNVAVHNHAKGNALIIAQKISERLIEAHFNLATDPGASIQDYT